MNAADIEDVYELSPLQQGILFHSLYDGDSDVYLNQRTFLIDGALDVDVLVRALQGATGAHPVLRTSFHWEGLDKPLQVVHRDAHAVIHRHDWSDLPDQQERFALLTAEDLAGELDPAVPPLQRLHVIRFGDRRFGLIWTHHLLLLDGWSVPIFLSDVLRRYAHLTLDAPAPDPAPPYRDYIAWLQGQDLDAAREFWSRTLDGRTVVTPLAPLLPADADGAAGGLDTRAARLPPGLEDALRATAAAHRVTVNTVLHAAWALVLQRYSGERDVLFGVVSAGRPAELPGVEKMMGLFTNTLPVPLSVPDDCDVGDWLRAIQADYAAIRRHEHSPLAQIKQWVGAPAAQPLFHSLVVFDNYSLAVDVGGLDRWLRIRPVDAVEKTSQPLVLAVTPDPRLTVRLRFHADRLAPAAAEEILACFEVALTALVERDRIARVAVAVAAVGGPRVTSSAPVHYADADADLAGLVLRQARATPRAPAVVTDDAQYGYAELLGRAERVAAAVQAHGVGPGDVVGVCAERSVDMVAGVLGVVLAGAAYLPLDPSTPIARLAFTVADAGCAVVLTQPACVALAAAAGARQVLVLDDLPPAPPGWTRPGVGGADAAYVLYTSGSTGRPKGVVVSHRAIVNRLLWMQQTFPIGADDRVLQKTPFAFDVSVWEIFWPLLTGAATVVAAPGGHQDAAYLAGAIVHHGITVAHFVPSMLHLFVDEPTAARLPSLRRVFCSGEELTAPLAASFRAVAPRVELHNLYGPTEAAVDVTWWDCTRGAPSATVPIGHPVANTSVHVLDRRLQEVPDGVAGELYLGGVQLARGYLRRPGLTAAAFVAHPLAGPGARLYRTGDRVRRRPDGALDFLGRLDHQVKVRGYRIELSEVEHVLVGHPRVREAAVVVRPRAGVAQLAAYLTVDGHGGADPESLRAYLRTQLPGYMVPATLTVLPAMPLTHNGKLDRAALPDPADRRAGAERPANLEEEATAAVFQEVLGLSEVDVTIGFFDLGGSSYDAVRAIRRIPGAGVALLVAHPSVRELTAALHGATRPSGILLGLTEPRQVDRTLVCVPFGGGSAISYQQLARALPARTALVAVALPGHELGGEPELRGLEEVAQETAAAVLRRGDEPVALYGHCVGVALAVEVVRRLEEAGRPVDRLYLAASYPFDAPGRMGRAWQRGLGALIGRGWMRVSARTVGLQVDARTGLDAAEMRYLRSIGGFDGLPDDAVDDRTDDELAFVMRAFRHDVAEAGRYFTARWGRAATTAPLRTPITFVAGSADPLTPRHEHGGRQWQRFGEHVDTAVVPGGGHYFHQHQAEIVAKLVTDGR